MMQRAAGAAALHLASASGVPHASQSLLTSGLRELAFACL